MVKPRLKANNILLHAAVIILVTFIYYYNSLNNFFYADDFIWLDRIKHLNGNWINIFNLENGYFTPLTYISFYVSNMLFGLTPYWYHLTDVTIHAMNGLLLYFLTNCVSKSRLISFIAALLFVTSCSTIITVIWSAARTDLLMVSLSLGVIITFINKSHKYRFMPLILYVLALCAKGTALVVPLILFLAIPKEKPIKSKIAEITPYFAVNAVYLLLLTATYSFSIGEISAPYKISFINIAGPLASLVVSERILAGTSNIMQGLVGIIIFTALVAVTVRANSVTVRLGTALTVCGILPLLTRSYVLAGSEASAYNMLGSPSNRMYLSCTGISLVCAFLLSKLIQPEIHRIFRIVSVAALVSLLCINYYENTMRIRIWSKGTSKTSYDLSRLNKDVSMLTEDSELLLYNFEGSTRFSRAMINAFFDLKRLDVNVFRADSYNMLTTVDESFIDKSYNNSSIKFVMSCPTHPYEDILEKDSNIILQSILAGYRNLATSTSAAESLTTTKRLENDIAKLKILMNECLLNLKYS